MNSSLLPVSRVFRRASAAAFTALLLLAVGSGISGCSGSSSGQSGLLLTFLLEATGGDIATLNFETLLEDIEGTFKDCVGVGPTEDQGNRFEQTDQKLEISLEADDPAMMAGDVVATCSFSTEGGVIPANFIIQNAVGQSAGGADVAVTVSFTISGQTTTTQAPVSTTSTTLVPVTPESSS